MRQKQAADAAAAGDEHTGTQAAVPTSAASAVELEIDGEKRKASKQILKNRGLMRIRPKRDRNVRVKGRRKYEKLEKKQKTMKQSVREADSSYGGEITGIKSTVVKSHKLRS